MGPRLLPSIQLNKWPYLGRKFVFDIHFLLIVYERLYSGVWNTYLMLDHVKTLQSSLSGNVSLLISLNGIKRNTCVVVYKWPVSQQTISNSWKILLKCHKWLKLDDSGQCCQSRHCLMNLKSYEKYCQNLKRIYSKTSNMKHAVICNKIVDHLDVVGATTSSFST